MTHPLDQRAGQVDAATLVARAAAGDAGAWQQLVDRHAGLIWAISRQFRLGDSDAADVSQTTWLRLLEHIDRLVDPARVTAWLATTARRECLRLVALRGRVTLVGDETMLDGDEPQPAVDERLLAEERARDVREAVATLPGHWQQLVHLLMADPPMSYAEISESLGLPVGSIGPTRGRCLDRLRAVLDPPGSDDGR